jgi:hypothetical protein
LILENFRDRFGLFRPNHGEGKVGDILRINSARQVDTATEPPTLGRISVHQNFFIAGFDQKE